jgi:glycosyltransferase involved in cell wall biosynthesis
MNDSISGRRIAFYTSSDCFGGLEKNILHFMEWLTNDNNEVILVSHPKHIISVKANSLRIQTVSSESTFRNTSLKKARKLHRVICKYQINVLFVIRTRDLIVSTLTKLIFCRKLKLIFIQQSDLYLKKHPMLYSLLFRPFDAWITTSGSMHTRAVGLTNYDPSRVYYIPPCIDLEYFEKNTLMPEIARKMLNLPQKRTIIGTIGRYDLKRKQDFLIRALQFLHHHNYDLDLLIMGKSGNREDLEYHQFLQELVYECQVEKFVHFRTYPDKIITFFRAINFFIMNWAGAAYDLILLKAMASGVPIIASYSDHNSELLHNGEYGMLYRANDIEDFTAKTIHLLTQPRLMDHLTKKSIQIVRDQYDRKIGCRKVEEIVDKLLGSR